MYPKNWFIGEFTRYIFQYGKGHTCTVHPFHDGDSLMHTLANNVDPDVDPGGMLHIVAFHQGLHCLLRP